ncbi:leader peptidase (prepilin peptidase) / N-methyltransferase [Plantibacter flavus]|uniref:Prepilin leader peptidase/N-methyltransferase n=1 Tax=Plantibacter flavus TaxID=150123 RepID=A0A3N2BXV9_9MICO|nr:A24 family peptidase [Plantibacter flavus]ROR80012.1 leader peptidase (prepilin peptidase)/N-methyltransferase [Plantibacter flavus]SMG28538.1 leader peptidase (prepilin peptidase) / N-methyltransferase [Plantibacter flavus]
MITIPDLGIVLPLALAGFAGLLVGSFLNVVIYRVPAGLSLVRPRSACPECGTQLRAMENLPVLSWLMLRGRCRHCHTRISAIYPLVEVGTALSFALVTAWLIAAHERTTSAAAFWVNFVAFLYLAAVSICLTLIDTRTHRLPDRIVLPMYPVGAVLFAVGAATGSGVQPLVTALLGAVGFWAAYALLRFAYPQGMGLGDVKLAGAVGLFAGWCGWESAVVAFFAPFILGGLHATVLLLTRRVTRKTPLPFGPWIISGTWLGVIAGPSVVAGYLALVGLTL